MKKRILIGGIGNIFQADDGFGVEVAQRLAERELPPEVEVVDFGIRGLDLAYALLDGTHDHVFLVDLVQRGGRPGTIYLIEPEVGDFSWEEAQDLLAQTHAMDPSRVLAWIKASGGETSKIRLIGCEPENLGSLENVEVGLSEPVSNAVDAAIGIIEELIEGALKPCTNWH